MAVIYQIIEGRDNGTVLIPTRKRGEVLVYTPPRGKLTPGRLLEDPYYLQMCGYRPDALSDVELFDFLGTSFETRIKILYMSDSDKEELLKAYDEMESTEVDGKRGFIRKSLNIEAQRIMERIGAENLSDKADKLLADAGISLRVMA